MIPKSKLIVLHQDQYIPISHLKQFYLWNVEIALLLRVRINLLEVVVAIIIIIGLL